MLTHYLVMKYNFPPLKILIIVGDYFYVLIISFQKEKFNMARSSDNIPNLRDRLISWRKLYQLKL